MARTCPSCNATYPDEVFFCGQDGAITVEEQDPKDFDPRLGKQLGGYVVVARVADGAMGRVFEGRHPDTKARVAVKVLHPDVARDPIAVERFKREFESSQELDHEHVVKVLEFGATPDGSHFLTMEFLEGEELGKLLGHDKPIAPARIVRIVSQVALALERAHSFGFIHRDLKPDNVFLCRTDEGDSVRVLDFGSVKLQMETGAKLTAIGTTLGSPFYMSPEQAMGRADVDQRTDVFALGAILYEMLTDKVAFDAPNIAKILLRIMNDNPKPPSQVVPSCPPALDRVVQKALHKEKEERYGSAAELAQAVIAGFGLSGTAEQWAHKPEAEVASAIAAAAPQPARKPAAPAADASPPAAPVVAARSAESVKDRGEPTLPKMDLPHDDGTAARVVPAGPNFGMMALVAVALAALGGVVTLLLK